MARAARASSTSTAHNGGGAPCSAAFHLPGYGLQVEQKHLPDNCTPTEDCRTAVKERNAMRNLNYQLKQLCHRNRDGSYATQSERERVLALVATQLHQLGFRNLTAPGLKPKHVEALVNRWTGEQLSAGTIKNRMAHLRWWAEKLDKATIALDHRLARLDPIAQLHILQLAHVPSSSRHHARDMLHNERNALLAGLSAGYPASYSRI